MNQEEEKGGEEGGGEEEEGEREGRRKGVREKKTVELFAVGQIVWLYSGDDGASASAEAFKVFGGDTNQS